MSDNKDDSNVFETIEHEDGTSERRVSRETIRKYAKTKKTLSKQKMVRKMIPMFLKR